MIRHTNNQDTDPQSCQFPHFIALCDHNTPTLQTDGRTNRRTEGQTDVMLVA